MLSKNEKLVLLLGSLACLLIIVNYLTDFYGTTISEYLFGETIFIEAIILAAAFLSISWSLIIVSRKEKVKMLEYFAIISAIAYIAPMMGIGLQDFNNGGLASLTYFLFGLAIIKIKKFGTISLVVGITAILTTLTTIISKAYIPISLGIITLALEAYILYKARKVL